MNGVEKLLSRSKAIGTECDGVDRELILWRTDTGIEFTTTYELAIECRARSKQPQPTGT